MPKALHSLQQWIHSASNQIMLLAAVRGTLSTALPLVVLHALGNPSAALFAAIGGLITSLADAGGPYRSRLLAMGLSALITPVSLFIGTQVHDSGWLATGLMFSIALAGGLIRTLGQPGTALGLFAGLVFLIGMHIPGTSSQALERAGYYFLGGMWAIVVTLAFWRLRPYKLIELEVTTCWAETARLVTIIRRLNHGAPTPSQTPEQAIARQHGLIRDLIEQVRYSLGEVFATTAGTSSTITQLIILLRAASHIAAAMLSLGAVLSASSLDNQARSLSRVIDNALAELEKACRAVAESVRTSQGSISLDRAWHYTHQLADLVDRQESDRPETNATRQQRQALSRALGQAMGHLQSAADALQQLCSQERRLPGLFPPLHRAAPSDEGLASLRFHLTFRSLIFRHALRVAVATSAGIALFSLLNLPHGMWIPLTSLLILQPNFGATLERALHRTGGTLAGAIMASILLAMLQSDIALYLTFTVLFFGTFLFFRRHYGVAVMLLTPLIILLLNLVTSAPWSDVGYRILNTLIGAALALVAGYLLWPSWERQRLPDQLASAIRANRDYACALLDTQASDALARSSLLELRHKAEIEANNALAAFRRMLAEPKAFRDKINETLTLVTSIQSLGRHLTALAVQLEDAQRLPELNALASVLGTALEEAAAAIQAGHLAKPFPALEESYSHIHATLTERKWPSADQQIMETHTMLVFLLDKIVSDVNGLYSAVS